MVETHRYAPEKDESDDYWYWAGLTYLLKKYKPVTLADAFHLVSVAEIYTASHAGGLSKRLKE